MRRIQSLRFSPERDLAARVHAVLTVARHLALDLRAEDRREVRIFPDEMAIRETAREIPELVQARGDRGLDLPRRIVRILTRPVTIREWRFEADQGRTAIEVSLSEDGDYPCLGWELWRGPAPNLPDGFVQVTTHERADANRIVHAFRLT